MSVLIANYEEERNCFQSLLCDPCEQRILLFRGESGTGKTTLMKACQQEVPTSDFLHVPIQLRQSAATVAEIFYRLGGKVGWDELTEFISQVAQLQLQPNINIEKNRMLGQNHISVALKAENPTDQAHRRAALTDALFAGLKRLSRPVLMMLDTYEDATTDVKNWIEGPFLARAVDNPRMRVLIAGQKVPDHNNIEWGLACLQRDLYGVSEAEHWLPVVDSMGKKIDGLDPLVFLAGICFAFKGNPDQIVKAISTLPNKQNN